MPRVSIGRKHTRREQLRRRAEEFGGRIWWSVACWYARGLKSVLWSRIRGSALSAQAGISHRLQRG
jgi:hypothetical protein